MPAKVTKITNKKCNPFTLDVMVQNPEAAFKFTLSVELSCSAQADQLWKLVFDLFKKTNNKFVQVVHVSFQAETPVEAAGIQATAKNGVNKRQSDIVVNKVHPLVVQISKTADPTPEQSQAVSEQMSAVAQAGNA